jgi:hypothetical protein
VAPGNRTRRLAAAARFTLVGLTGLSVSSSSGALRMEGAEGSRGAALALLRRVQAATRSAQTLTAEYRVRIQEDGMPPALTRGKAALKKPNLARLEWATTSEPQRAEGAYISDGTSLTVLDTASKVQQQEPLRLEGLDLWRQGVPSPIRFFFRSPQLVRQLSLGEGLSLAGREAVAGVGCRIVEATSTLPGAGRTRLKLFVGPDRLVRRVTARTLSLQRNRMVDAVLQDVRVGKPLSAKTFQPPPGTRPALLALGAAAPLFALPTPGGGSVALADTLGTAKAVLINFWFYG